MLGSTNKPPSVGCLQGSSHFWTRQQLAVPMEMPLSRTMCRPAGTVQGDVAGGGARRTCGDTSQGQETGNSGPSPQSRAEVPSTCVLFF